MSTIGVFMGAISGAGATFFGVSALRTFAIGALGVDFTAYFIAPLYGIEMEGIEFEPMESSYKPPKMESLPPHPYTKRKGGRS